MAVNFIDGRLGINGTVFSAAKFLQDWIHARKRVIGSISAFWSVFQLLAMTQNNPLECTYQAWLTLDLNSCAVHPTMLIR